MNFTYDEKDIISTDKYLNFCLQTNINYLKTDVFYHGRIMRRGSPHPERIFQNRPVVIGHSDAGVTDEVYEKLKSLKIEKAFCINRLTDNPNVFGIPLGITNNTNESHLHPIYGNTEMMVKAFNTPPKITKI